MGQVHLLNSLSSHQGWVLLEEKLQTTKESLTKEMMKVDLRHNPGKADEIRGEVKMIDQILKLVDQARNFDFGKAQDNIAKKRNLLTGFRRT